MHTKSGRVQAELEERMRVHIPVLLPANLQLEQVGEDVLRREKNQETVREMSDAIMCRRERKIGGEGL